ncbi:MAG: molecular chaperone HtpG, partial [Bacteroidota bacterium]
KKVEVVSKSFKKGPGSKAVRWTCEGNPEYTLEPADRKERGTDIILHLADDAKEYLEDNKVREILNKYCKFLPVEIQFGHREETIKEGEGEEATEEKVTVPDIINNPAPAWTKKPADLSDEDYSAFYRELYPFTFDEPLFNIHLNVDYPFNLTGVLYFPKLKDKFEFQRNKIQLYCNQVFVTDSVEGIVPEFLTLLHGVLDSPDIPLNVSRSYLQSDSNVKKISNHITKKVADKLQDMFKKDRDDYQAKWDDIKIFIEYGILTDEKFYERIEQGYLLKNTEGAYATMEEYREKIKDTQTDKDGKVVHLYATNAEEQHTFIEAAKSKGYDVLLLEGPLVSHMVGKLEQHLENASFVRVDADTLDKLIRKDEVAESNLTEDQQKVLQPLVESALPKEKFTVVFESLSEDDSPMIITRPEQMRRMKDMSEMGGGGFGGAFPEMYNLVVNANHPLVSKILLEQDEARQQQLAKQGADLALLSQGMLKGSDLTDFIKRSVNLID